VVVASEVPTGVEPDAVLTGQVCRALVEAGIDRVGVAAVEVFEDTRRQLHSRKAAGLHGGMDFTYRNPDRSTDPSRLVGGARSLVVGALGYRRPEPSVAPPDQAVARGRIARYAWWDVYGELAVRLVAGVEVLRSHGWRAVVVVDQNSLVDREAARRAGLGWYGRNANLLVPGRGSWFVLGTIATDAPLAAATPVESGCGACRACLSSCPTDAIVAPGIVDAGRCLAWLLQRPGVFPRQFRVALGVRIYGCDDCQEACPPNRTAPPGVTTGHDGGTALRASLDIAELLVDDDAAVLAAARRWYVPGRRAAHLRRNALLVLGNGGEPTDPRVLALVGHALAGRDPLVRAHAVWAAARLGRPDLADPLVGVEADPMVRDELDRRSEVPARGPAASLAATSADAVGGAVRP